MMKVMLLLPLVLCIALFSSAVPVQSQEPRSAVGEGQKTGQVPAGSVEEDLSLRVPLGSPVFSDFPLAVVDGEQITVRDLRDALGTLHGGMKGEKVRKKKDYTELLDRLIAAKLILHEARNMGLEELPEVKNAVDRFSRDTLLEELQEEVTREVKADEKQVDSLYRDIVKRWKIRSLAFEKEEDARKAVGAISAGKDFGVVAADAVARGAAKSEETLEAKPQEFLPVIAAEVSRMKEGSVSPVIKVESKGKPPAFVIVKFEGPRYPEDPVAREQAGQEALGRKKFEVLLKFNEALTKKYVTTDDKLFEALDYNVAADRIDKLLKDKRVLARIKGDKPITVADFSDALKKKFFHGMERAAGAGKITKAKKITVLEDMLARRTLRLEARKRGIDKSGDYLRRVNEYREAVLFGLFAQKVVAPDIRLDEADLRKYYEIHSPEYSIPRMLRLDSIVLQKRDEAVDVFERAKKGDDFKWLKENTEGQVVKGSKGLLTFPDGPVLESEVPVSLHGILSGAQAGDVRLYSSPEGYHYLLYVRESFPGGVQKFEDVQDDIAKKVFSEKVKKAIDEWGEKLKEHLDVKIYLAR